MKHLISPSGLTALRAFALNGALLGLDYDGTLAPIVGDPANARMLDRTRALLERVVHCLPTVIITGRDREDMRRLLHGVHPLDIIGNHGADVSQVLSPESRQRVDAWLETLSSRIAGLPGVVIEDKEYSLSIHYRHSPDHEAARCAVLEAVSGLEGARVVGGKAVVNLLLREAPDKGAALLLACTRRGCSRAIYVGDDVTDEDVFALDRPDQVLTVRVGRDAGSRAAYYLRDCDEVDGMLEALLAATA